MSDSSHQNEAPDPLAGDKAAIAAAEIAALKQAIEKKEITWAELLRLSSWRILESAEPGPDWEKKKFAEQNYLAALRIFQGEGEKRVQVALFPDIGGIRLERDGTMMATIQRGALSFDSSRALQMIFRLDALAAQVREWWSPDQPKARAIFFFWTRIEANFGPERTPHSLRAYGLGTWVLGCVSRAKARIGVPEKGEPPREADEHLVRELELTEPQIADAEREFRSAAQRGAQIRYGRGMVRGAIGLALVSFLIGVALWAFDAKAEYAVAFATGGIGAIVSVLQRMTSNRLRLDFQTSGGLLEAFGALRPVVGAVFGMALVTLLQAGLLPALEVSDVNALAFNAGIGFLAGFNERFAQDVLVGSARRVTDTTRTMSGGVP